MLCNTIVNYTRLRNSMLCYGIASQVGRPVLTPQAVLSTDSVQSMYSFNSRVALLSADYSRPLYACVGGRGGGCMCIVLYLSIYIAPLEVHTNQRRSQYERPREKKEVFR